MKNWTWAGNVHLQPRKPTISWLHKKKRGQQVKREDSAPLLHTGESPPGVLRPVLGSPVQDRCGPVRAGPEEKSQNWSESWNSFPVEKDWVGVVQPGEVKSLEHLIVAFQWGSQERQDFLPRPVVTGQGAVILHWKRVGLIRHKKFSYSESGKTQEQVAQRNCGCGCSTTGNVQGQVACLSNMMYWAMSLPIVGGWTRWSFKVLYSPNHSMILQEKRSLRCRYLQNWIPFLQLLIMGCILLFFIVQI